MASHLATHLLLAVGCVAGAFAAEKLIFSTQTHPSCPVMLSSAKASKSYAFQSAQFRNESRIAVDSLQLQVTLSTASGKELIESAVLAASLAPHEAKRLDIGLGRIRDLYRKAKPVDQDFVAVILSIEAVQFAGGGQWRPDEPLIYDPAR